LKFIKNKEGEHDLTKVYKAFEKHLGEIVMIRLYESEGLVVIEAGKSKKNNDY